MLDVVVLLLLTWADADDGWGGWLFGIWIVFLDSTVYSGRVSKSGFSFGTG